MKNFRRILSVFCSVVLTVLLFSVCAVPTIAAEALVSEGMGSKVVFVQCAMGATGCHEWTKNPEDYVCDCNENGKYLLYSNAAKNFLKTYNALSEDYNIVNTGYIWNQGGHEQTYAVPGATIHDEQTYYDALLSIHSDLTSDLGLDFGGIVVTRYTYTYDKACLKKFTEQEVDNEQHSRAYTSARQAQYRAANEVDNLFIIDNNAEKVNYNTDDPSNRRHYAQVAYNDMGKQAGESIAMYTQKGNEADFEGIVVYNAHGVELATFDMNGKLVSGSATVQYTEDNVVLQIMIRPLGTYYTFDLTTTKLADFVDIYGKINWEALQNAGYTSFELIINPPQ